MLPLFPGTRSPPPAVSFLPLPGNCIVNPIRLHRQGQIIPRPKRPRTTDTRKRCHEAIRADLGPVHRDHSVSGGLFSRIMDLEDALDNAVDAEEYANAADIRDQLTLAKNEDCVLILSAHLSYYDAFNEHSLQRLSSLWHNKPSVICQHPLSSCHVGYDAVMTSFATLFSTLPADLVIEVSDVRIASFGPAAYVTCIETPKSSMLPVGKDGRERQHGLQATSVFEKHLREDGTCEYLMVHHVSAPIFGALSVL